ncbi:hypothetical protein ACIKTA_04995 [Hansschlegelia beijingensis]
MTAQTPVLPPILPENAPFSPEQRAWLNGVRREPSGGYLRRPVIVIRPVYASEAGAAKRFRRPTCR